MPGRKELWLFYWIQGERGPRTPGPKGGGSFYKQAISWWWQQRKSAQGDVDVVAMPLLSSVPGGFTVPWFFLRQTEMGDVG